jgi:hypothetical protein
MGLPGLLQGQFCRQKNEADFVTDRPSAGLVMFARQHEKLAFTDWLE